MQIYGIDRDTKAAFEELAPADLWLNYLKEDFMVLGAVADEDEEVSAPTAAGVFAFYLKGDEAIPIWCYVHSSFRRKGIATEVFKRASEALQKEDITIRVYGLVKGRYEGWQEFISGYEGAVESDTEENYYIFPAGDIKTKKKSYIFATCCIPIEEISIGELRKFAASMDQNKRRWFFRCLSDEALHPMSMVYTPEDKMVGCLLLNKFDDDLAIVFCHGMDGDKDVEEIMLNEAIRQIQGMSENINIAIMTENDESNKYIKNLLEVDAHKVKVCTYTL